MLFYLFQAFAQERVIEEVVVTALRKKHLLQDLPITIQRLLATVLKKTNFDVESLSQNVPGLVHSKALGSGVRY